ncbi:MAG: hypothetical protein EZS28_033590 [Streblomastix strix]|uniref:Uncharacterized protein n=1 Tax=Streblomastix strix TaxID=222440 RepID=A0A5J4UKU5_9EUKA|nr:MAG: hypothetical protein EZS28_033590 [Streblomastix strix]
MGIYVILFQPFTLTFGNQIHTSCLFIAAGGGLTSICLSGLKRLASIGRSNITNGFKLFGWFQIVGVNIIIYLSIILFSLILGWVGYILAKKAAIKNWILKPVYEQPKCIEDINIVKLYERNQRIHVSTFKLC